jgi:hypothetical protein
MSTDFNCCDFGTCNQGIGCPAGSVVAQKLVGAEPLPGLMTYDLATKQWITRPLYNHLHTENSAGSDSEVDEVEAPDWEAIAIVGGALILFLASVVGIGMAVLHFYG